MPPKTQPKRANTQPSAIAQPSTPTPVDSSNETASEDNQPTLATAVAVKSTKNTRRNYTIKQKIDILTQYEKNVSGKGINSIAKQFNVPRTTLQKWIDRKDELFGLLQAQDVITRQRRRLPGGGAQPQFVSIEEAVLAFTKERNEKGIRVTSKDMQVTYFLFFSIFYISYFLFVTV